VPDEDGACAPDADVGVGWVELCEAYGEVLQAAANKDATTITKRKVILFIMIFLL